MLKVNQLFGFGVGRAARDIKFVGYRTASLANSATASFNLPTTGLTGGIDTEVRVGDYLLVVCGWSENTNGNPGVTDATLTWTEDLDSYQGSTINTSFSRAHVNVTPPANITVSAVGLTSHNSGALMFVFRNVEPGNVVFQSTTGTGAPNSPSATPVRSNGVAVAMAHTHIADGQSGFSAGPAGYSGYTALNLTSSLWDNGFAAAYKELSSTSAENPGAFTAEDQQWVAATYILSPI